MGSHQSEAEVDQIAAEQPALLAAATARKSSNKKVPKDARVGKKLFTFPKAKEQTSWKAGRRRSGKTSPASFSLVKAKFSPIAGALLYVWVISRTSDWNGSFRMSNSVDFW